MRRIEAIDSTLNGLPQNIIRGIAYRGDNQVIACTFGNGLIDAREYDLQGRLTHQRLKDEFDLTIDERTYAYDKNSNILSIDTDFEDNAYLYDRLDRVVGDTSLGNPEVNATPIAFSYDLNDNRLSRDKTDLSEVNGYEYLDASNRLIAQETFSPAGPSPIPERDRELVYNDAGRLFQLFENGTLRAEYVYNDEGQRTRKVTYAADGLTIQAITIFHYDYMGYLITETEETGQLIRDYIWMESMHPVAQIDNDGTSETISYLYTDHLMTNRLATDEFGQVIWRWEGEAFGNTPSEELASVSINLRFPGQYFDTETNLHYNWHRYYDPELGRYITSDPVGLSSGANTYAYVEQNSLSFTDRFGLHLKCVERADYYTKIVSKRIRKGEGYWQEHCYLISETRGNVPDPHDSRGPRSTVFRRALRNLPFEIVPSGKKCVDRYTVTQEEEWEDVQEEWVHRWLECIDTCTGEKKDLWAGPDEPVNQ